MSSELSLIEKHPELFHYTTEAGVMEILRKQYLWSTHWRHLNDTSELDYFTRNCLLDLIRPGRMEIACERMKRDKKFRSFVKWNGGIEKLVEKSSKGLTNALHESVINPNPEEQLFDFFITSLSTPEGAYEGVRENGLLSQWRYYGENGGFAIVFDTKQLEELISQEHNKRKHTMTFGEVAYSNESLDEIGSKVDSLPLLVKEINACGFETENECEPILMPLLQCVIHYKHWCFSEEAEVRIVSILDGPRIRSLRNEDSIEPHDRERYHENGAPRIHLFEGLEVTDRPYRLPIKRIIVGPGPSQCEREVKLRGLLAELQYDIPVSLSNMPIRF